MECSVEGCNREAKKRYLCLPHYLQAKRKKQLNKHPQMPRGRIKRVRTFSDQSLNGECRADDCHKAPEVRGFCRWCYERFWSLGLIETDQLKNQKAKNASGVCEVPRCKNSIKHDGLCCAHYHRRHKYGDPTFLTTWAKNRGKPKVDAKGYVTLFMPRHPMSRQNGLVFEHRIVMAKIIGRDLTPNENVHHINGKRSDNRPQNLELWVTAQPCGQRAQDLVSWANEILARYPSEIIIRLNQISATS